MPSPPSGRPNGEQRAFRRAATTDACHPTARRIAATAADRRGRVVPGGTTQARDEQLRTRLGRGRNGRIAGEPPDLSPQAAGSAPVQDERTERDVVEMSTPDPCAKQVAELVNEVWQPPDHQHRPGEEDNQADQQVEQQIPPNSSVCALPRDAEAQSRRDRVISSPPRAANRRAAPALARPRRDRSAHNGPPFGAPAVAEHPPDPN